MAGTEEITATRTRTVTLERGHMYVHCHVNSGPIGVGLRIWPSTFVLDPNGDERSVLLHAEKISMAPQWTWVKPHMAYQFLLIFAALSPDCRVFDLVEEIPQAGGFEIRNIARNDQDVYHVQIEG